MIHIDTDATGSTVSYTNKVALKTRETNVTYIDRDATCNNKRHIQINSTH